MDTYCRRSWTWHEIHLDRLLWKMCCKTSYRKIESGKDWSNSAHMRERRQQHLSGERHPDCAVCWGLEDRGVQSPRQIENSYNQPRFEHLNSANRHLELLVSNTCDLACRYCASSHSSVWAERLQDDEWQKTALRSLQDQQQYNNLLQETYAWIDDRMDHWDAISFTGGEVAIMPRFYDITETMQIKGKLIKIMTNLNTPDAYMDRFVNVLQKLAAAGNTVEIRASIDGIGDKNDWQRQGADWTRMRKNWLRLAKLPVQIYVALTMTPLTLEGMVDVGRFVVETADQFVNAPCWEICNHVSWPQQLDAQGWYNLFKSDIMQFQQLITAPGVRNTGTFEQTEEWLQDSKTIAAADAQLLVQYLDEQQQLWGGCGAWRDIYPRVWALCEERL